MTQWGASYSCCGCSFAAFFGFTVTLFYITDLIILLYHRKQRQILLGTDANKSQTTLVVKHYNDLHGSKTSERGRGRDEVTFFYVGTFLYTPWH